jgi:BirA family biotin operon repressor/biotin-[acetyl-CoA-carboxylase] ligase
VNSHIGLPFLVLDTVDSTNNYAIGQLHAGLAKHGQVYFAHHQFAGKGQRGKTWNAAAGENITMSIILIPGFPNNQFSFLLSASVGLACVHFLKQLNIDELTIKWPNDIYWRDRKAGGILIENLYRSNEWKFAVVGIGININQTSFNGINAVSVKQITGTHFQPLVLSEKLCEQIDHRFNQLYLLKPELIMREYNSCLYKKDELAKLKKGNIAFDTVIKEVTLSGDLLTSDVMDRSFSFGEVEWL